MKKGKEKDVSNVRVPASKVASQIAIMLGMTAVIIVMFRRQALTWPLFLCLFYFTSVAETKLEKVAALGVWGAVGLFAGYVRPLLEPFTGELIASLAMVVFLLAIVFIVLKNVFKSFNSFCFLMLTISTSSIPNVCTVDNFLTVFRGYVAGIALMVALGVLFKLIENMRAKENLVEEAVI